MNEGVIDSDLGDELSFCLLKKRVKKSEAAASLMVSEKTLGRYIVGEIPARKVGLVRSYLDSLKSEGEEFRLPLVCSQAQFAAYSEQAAVEGQALNEWLLSTLDLAAGC